MNKLEEVIEYVKLKLNNEVTAHDFLHSHRVMKIARYIGENSKNDVDLEIIQVAAITHDVIDKKVADNIEAVTQELTDTLLNIGYLEKQVNLIISIIQNMSYSTGRIPASEEGKIVQDADRLESIGAIAIARTFAYGGKLNRVIYEEDSSECSIAHFYEKLLLLKDMMNTEIGKEIAVKRHKYMEEYLTQFYSEWNLEDF